MFCVAIYLPDRNMRTDWTDAASAMIECGALACVDGMVVSLVPQSRFVDSFPVTSAVWDLSRQSGITWKRAVMRMRCSTCLN